MLWAGEGLLVIAETPFAEEPVTVVAEESATVPLASTAAVPAPVLPPATPRTPAGARRRNMVAP